MAATNLGTKQRATFAELRVAQLRRLTPDSVEVTFAVPEELSEHYRFRAGQYLALRTTIDGEDVRRSYSICHPPADGTVSVAVKRDQGGLFSTWVNDTLKVGDALQVMTPQGTFTSQLASLDGAHGVGIAAGSGITPVITLAHHFLSGSNTSRFDLIFTNKSSSDVMFVEEIADLKDRYRERFAVHHVLSREQRSAPILSGRLDDERLRTLLTQVIPTRSVAEWVLCGPYDLVQLCREILADLGVTAEQVRYELFTSGAPGSADATPRARPVTIAAGEKTFTIDLTLDGTSATVMSPVSANETLLNAALRVRSDVPFACAGGVCGTCRARVTEGEVTMTENYALEADEIARGYVLTCQSHPQSDRVVVNYDA